MRIEDCISKRRAKQTATKKKKHLPHRARPDRNLLVLRGGHPLDAAHLTATDLFELLRREDFDHLVRLDRRRRARRARLVYVMDVRVLLLLMAR